ncbi:MAG: aminomethyl-transferring glycine dehydrogenase subunit GcvPB [Bacillota bacterium]
MSYDKLIFDLGSPGRRCTWLPEQDVPSASFSSIPKEILAGEAPPLPEVTEAEVARHYTRLSQLNYSVDTDLYPLGSCTMKYNPKVLEDAADLPGFQHLHPYQPEEMVQGALRLIYEMGKYLCGIGGMDQISFQPAAGAHGEFAGMQIVRAYFNNRGEGNRTRVVIPDSAHGTNPASASMGGFEIVQVVSNQEGEVDLEQLKQVLDQRTAALMLTNPNTLGLFEKQILEIAALVHQCGALLYYDGANMNAILGITRPGDMGFDVMHFNLHKTFGAPHGGGGPGSGPVAVKDFLAPFLPGPTVEYDEKKKSYFLDGNRPLSIGRIRSFYGNFAIVVKAYAYLRGIGQEGLSRVGEHAVLNANYLMHRLAATYNLPFNRTCQHEFVINPKNFLPSGLHTLDIAKRLMDYGFHPPTIYFPLIVEEAMMIEPTETETRETLDRFAEAMENIARECAVSPDVVKEAPHHTPVGRLDEVGAARHPCLRWGGEGGCGQCTGG